MKNIFKGSKCGIAALLTICILLGISGTGVHATAMAEENPIATEESAVETADAAQELVPMMATRCGTTKDPLENYFGKYYEVTRTNGPWQYITGTTGITGAYNTSTGYGYVNMSDGSISPFQISV